MNPFIEEAGRLLRLARKDRLACKLLLPVEELASNVASFHAQQAAEKALKAVMALHGIGFRRVHDLEELASRLSASGHPVPVPEAQLSCLTPYAVEFRYNDDPIPLIEPSETLSLADQLLDWAHGQLANARKQLR